MADNEKTPPDSSVTSKTPLLEKVVFPADLRGMDRELLR